VDERIDLICGHAGFQIFFDEIQGGKGNPTRRFDRLDVGLLFEPDPIFPIVPLLQLDGSQGFLPHAALFVLQSTAARARIIATDLRFSVSEKKHLSSVLLYCSTAGHLPLFMANELAIPLPWREGLGDGVGFIQQDNSEDIPFKVSIPIRTLASNQRAKAVPFTIYLLNLNDTEGI
jgi:hypothetical protein